MTADEYKQAVKELMTIPAVGRTVADDLIQLGIKKVSDLKGLKAERLYSRSNRAAGLVQDKCLLYTFRCAIYFASNENHEPEKLLWYNWKEAGD
ncbi:MAG: pathogenicity locus [Bacteroidetes bacterium]|nr:pathogenicity locus [Bacteroidota bacterium]MBK8658965.1 pathogenicity locus [Bacteroidota bacterium]